MVRQVAIVAFSQNPYYSEVVSGAIRWVREHGTLDLMHWQGEHLIPPAALTYIRPDGLLAGFADRKPLPEHTRELPILGFSHARATAPFPRRISDDRTLGRLAADKVLASGYDRIVVLRHADEIHLEHQRLKGLVEAAGEHVEVVNHRVGEDPSHPSRPFAETYALQEENLNALLKVLAPGSCLVACRAGTAFQVLRIAEAQARFNIPEEFGILLLDQAPPNSQGLAHVRMDGFGVGYALLGDMDLWLRKGIPPAYETVFCPPHGILPEQTLRTDEVTRLYQRMEAFCDARLCETIRIPELAMHLGKSRRSLEIMLKKNRLPSPYELVTRKRLERAKDLLLTNELSLSDIAAATGFSNTRMLTERFRAHFGETPFAYRKKACG